MGQSGERDIWIGIDIGNTKSEYLACDESGSVVSYWVGPGANHQEVGTDELRRLLNEAYSKLIDETMNPVSVFIGAAGADTAADVDVLAPVFSDVFDPVPCAFDNDGLIALRNGIGNERGLVVTCGTGNTNFARDSAGRIERIGGLTDHLGDVLGAYAIARATLSAAVRGEDHRDSPTILSRLLAKEFAADSMADLMGLQLNPDSVKRTIATLFEATSCGDGRALSLTWYFVQEIVRIVDLFAASLFRDGEPFRVVLDGPVYREEYTDFLTMIRLALTARYPVEIILPETPPVVGALYLALEHSSKVLSESYVKRIHDTFLRQRVGA